MHVDMAKTLDVPAFALCASSEKLSKEDLAGQTKFTGQNLHIYILSNYFVLPHEGLWIEGLALEPKVQD